MTFRAYPTKMEIWYIDPLDPEGKPDGYPHALVEMQQDEEVAAVKLDVQVNAADWAELADAIGEALKAMALREDVR